MSSWYTVREPEHSDLDDGRRIFAMDFESAARLYGEFLIQDGELEVDEAGGLLEVVVENDFGVTARFAITVDWMPRVSASMVADDAPLKVAP